MTDKPSSIPPDDLNRTLAVSKLNDPEVPVVAQAGGVYTILMTGAQTGGRYCLFDMLVPPGGGPPPHRHDFEEMFTLLVKGEYSSYRDLPVVLYQVQTKYRDEARPRSGILRAREFVMKDSYSFDLTDEALGDSYAAHRAA